MKIYHFTLLVLGFLLSSCGSEATNNQPDTAPPSTSSSPTTTADNIDPTIQLPVGFNAYIFAEEVGRVRHIAVRENGDLYAQLGRKKDEHGLVALRDTDGDDMEDERKYFGEHSGTGIAINGNKLYCSSDTEILSYELTDGLLPDLDSKILVIGGFPAQNQHAAKSFTFDNQNNIYVNVGAPSNACQKEARTVGSFGIDPCPQLERQGGIWKFSLDKIAQTQTANGQRYATGIRNAIALDWNTITNSLYAVQHGRDQLHTLFPKLFSERENAELPSEEFIQVSEGDDFGWPYCYFNHEKGVKLLAPEYGGNRKIQNRCLPIKKPVVGFPGHLAPNDLLFYTGDLFPARYKNGAFIAFHGSWNRAPLPQKGFFVAFVPMNAAGKATGKWEIFAEGFAGSENISSPQDAQYRPCGLAQDTQGNLYISDSVEGKIWKIKYEK